MKHTKNKAALFVIQKKISQFTSFNAALPRSSLSLPLLYFFQSSSHLLSNSIIYLFGLLASPPLEMLAP